MTAPVLPTIPPRRLYVIDALRGIAAFYVVIFHTAKIPQPSLDVPRWLEPFIDHGGTGVTLFFVLSAFTLCYTLDGRSGDRFRIIKFYCRRAFRIVPLYLVWLAIMLFVLHAHGPDFGYLKLLACLTFTYNFVPSWREGVVWASWTLGVEMIFYLVFPFLFQVVRSVRSAVGFVLIAAAIAAAHQAIALRGVEPTANLRHYIHMSVLHQLPVFAVGMLVYFCYRDVRIGAGADRWLGSVLFGTGLVSYLALCLLNVERIGVEAVYPAAICYGVATLGLLWMPVAPMANRAFGFVGLISYSMYLNHPRIVYFLVPAFRWITGLRWPVGLAFAASVVVVLVPLVLVSTLTYLAIEQPFIRLGGQLIRRLDPSGRYRSTNELSIRADFAPAPSRSPPTAN